KHRCGYEITVTNTGPDDYNGKIVVQDTIPAGTTATFSGVGWNACPGGPPTYTRTHAPVLLHVTEQRHLIARVDVPDALVKQRSCKLTNKVKITFAPGGTSQNTNPGDDQSQATADLPAELCREPEPVPLVKVCPEGTTGQYPNCRRIVVDTCPEGTVGRWPN